MRNNFIPPCKTFCILFFGLTHTKPYICRKEMKIMEERITPYYITKLADKKIFVFGSNLSGSHGGGAALLAYQKFGAVWGQGVGLQGQSYGIPTMQGGTDTIQPYVNQFIDYARTHPTQHFLVTRIGCGIAGFSAEEIAPLFADAADISNISLPQDFWNEIQIS